MANKMASSNILLPHNILWGYHVIIGNENAYNKIWNDHLQCQSPFKFHAVLDKARKEQNEKLLFRVIDFFKTTKVSDRTFGLAYGAILDIYSDRGELDQSLKFIESIAQHISLHNVSQSTLAKIKKGFEAEGKHFPYSIPVKLK